MERFEKKTGCGEWPVMFVSQQLSLQRLIITGHHLILLLLLHWWINIFSSSSSSSCLSSSSCSCCNPSVVLSRSSTLSSAQCLRSDVESLERERQTEHPRIFTSASTTAPYCRYVAAVLLSDTTRWPRSPVCGHLVTSSVHRSTWMHFFFYTQFCILQNSNQQILLKIFC